MDAARSNFKPGIIIPCRQVADLDSYYVCFTTSRGNIYLGDDRIASLVVLLPVIFWFIKATWQYFQISNDPVERAIALSDFINGRVTNNRTDRTYTANPSIISKYQ